MTTCRRILILCGVLQCSQSVRRSPNGGAGREDMEVEKTSALVISSHHAGGGGVILQANVGVTSKPATSAGVALRKALMFTNT